MSWTGPSAAINWDGLNNIRVYGQDPEGNIMEWACNSRGKWSGPNKIGAKAAYGTDMTAVFTQTDGNIRIRVYYYGQDNRVYEMVYEDGWSNGSQLP